MYKSTCKICKKEISSNPKRIFCSYACSGFSRRKPFKKCANCHNPVNWRGKRVKFCSKSCKSQGKNNPRYKGGTKIDIGGYRMLWIPPEQRKNSNAYVREHRYLMEQHLGRKLLKGEVVHHKNGNKLDNRLSNLEVMTLNDHLKHHAKERINSGQSWGFIRKRNLSPT